MNFLLIPKELRPIAAKVEARQRISEADALDLYRSNDLNALGIMASAVREQKNATRMRLNTRLMKLFASSAKLFLSALPKSTWSAAFTRHSKKIGISNS